MGGSIGFLAASEGMKLQERNDLLSYGEQSQAHLITKDGNPVGNLFIARKGTRVLAVTFAGVYFDDPEVFAALMAPKLAAFERLKR